MEIQCDPGFYISQLASFQSYLLDNFRLMFEAKIRFVSQIY